MTRCTFLSRPVRGRTAGLLALAAGGVAIGCSGEAPPAPEVVRPAKLVTLSAASDIRTLNFPAVIEAATSSVLTFQVGGLLKELPVSAGDDVFAGDVIGRLDARDYDNRLAATQAQFDNASSEFERAERLLAQNAVSRSVFEQRRSQRDITAAELETARKALEDTVLRTPFDGVIAAVHTEAFQNLQPLEPVVTLQTLGSVMAVIQVPAQLVARSGQIEPLETLVVLDAAPDSPVPAVIESTGAEADPTTQSFTVKFGFTPPDDLLILPGMTGSVRSTLAITRDGGARQRLTVPLSAVVSDGASRYVWVVDDETMRVARRDITVGQGVGETLAVQSGLTDGEIVVAAGASFLHAGMRVRPYMANDGSGGPR